MYSKISDYGVIGNLHTMALVSLDGSIDWLCLPHLDQELTIAGQAFLNGGGVVVDRERERVTLSRIFKWYGNDFAGSVPERLKFAASFLYDQSDREFLRSRAGKLAVDYQDYDWRLNRT